MSDNNNGHVDAFDALEAAAEATIQARPIFGEIDLDAYACAFESGTGKIRLETREEMAAYEAWKVRTSLDWTIFPLAGSRMANAIKRNMCAEGDWDKATRKTVYTWIRLVRPSLVECLGHEVTNTDLKALTGKYAKITITPDGRKYRNKEGEERESSTIKFLAIYDTEAECQAAYDAEYGNAGAQLADIEDEPLPIDPPKKDTGVGKDTALQFLEALVAESGNDMTKLNSRLQMMPMITQYFPLDSAELTAEVDRILEAA